MAQRYSSVLETIGRTPVIRLNKLAPPGIELYVKAESFNPMGSVKDRLALGVIEDAERSGALKPGQTVIEATSGNTGIGLAMVCAQKGYPLVVTMAESFSIERRKLMRFLGARVVLTPAAEKGSGMLAKAVELSKKHGWFLCRQFENEANADVHSRTTAQEILADFAGERLDYWVTGFGTGGTLKGVARVLKSERPETRVIVCEPDNSPILGSGIAQARRPDGAPSASHPYFRPHLMQGWSPDFIPKLAEDAVAGRYIDRVLPVSGAEALRLSRELARQEGIFVGISSGATLAGALAVSASAEQGSVILCMLPDTGERYLSTPLFEDIPIDMTAEELEISKSTPGYRFDQSPPPTPAPTQVSAAADDAVADDTAISAETEAFLDAALTDPDHPVVLFALEWCEFCWSVRKMFKTFGIDYRAIDLDSVEYQVDDRGGQIRRALNARFGIKTIPQVFVGGERVGGATDVFDAWQDNRLQSLLSKQGVAFDATVTTDPYSLLPGWLHKR